MSSVLSLQPLLLYSSMLQKIRTSAVIVSKLLILRLYKNRKARITIGLFGGNCVIQKFQFQYNKLNSAKTFVSIANLKNRFSRNQQFGHSIVQFQGGEVYRQKLGIVTGRHAIIILLANVSTLLVASIYILEIVVMPLQAYLQVFIYDSGHVKLEKSAYVDNLTSVSMTFASDIMCSVEMQIRCADGSYISTKYCGYTLPSAIYINNCIQVLVLFRTDGSVVDIGFALQYVMTRISK